MTNARQAHAGQLPQQPSLGHLFRHQSSSSAASLGAPHSPPHRAAASRGVDIRIPAVEKYAYCLCLHVKPATIFIAVIKLIRTLLVASIVLNSEFTIPESADQMYLRNRSTAAAVTILMLILMASVSAIGIYAVLSERAALLMPLYAIMLCDFFFALPAVYHREWDGPVMNESAAAGGGGGSGFPGGSQSAALQNARISQFVVSTLMMIIKIYFLCVVWKCYRYLRLRELILPLRIAAEMYPQFAQGAHPIVRVLGSGDSSDLNGAASLAPPSYDAIVSSKTQPPNYEEAMKSTSISFCYPPELVQNQQQQQALTQQLQLQEQRQLHASPAAAAAAATTTTTTANSQQQQQQDTIPRPFSPAREPLASSHDAADAHQTHHLQLLSSPNSSSTLTPVISTSSDSDPRQLGAATASVEHFATTTSGGHPSGAQSTDSRRAEPAAGEHKRQRGAHCAPSSQLVIQTVDNGQVSIIVPNNVQREHEIGDQKNN